MDWRSALNAIKVRENAGSDIRISDEFPIEYTRLSWRVEQAEEFVYARNANLIRWCYFPLDRQEYFASALTLDEEKVRRIVALDGGGRHWR